jgi:hypothetical protein
VADECVAEVPERVGCVEARVAGVGVGAHQFRMPRVSVLRTP